MATSSTLTAIRTRIGQELGICQVIPNGFVSSIAAGSVTAPGYLQNSRWGVSEFSSKKVVIHRPASATSADYIRYSGDLTATSGLLAQTGANYADTIVGSETVELWRFGVRPDVDVLNAINRAMEFIFYDSFVALSHLSAAGLDGDMAVSTDTAWTDVGTPTTSAKSTTARRTPFGMRSYHLVGDAVNEGTRSATLGVTQGKNINAFTIISADTGTVSFQPYDITNSATFGTAVTHSEEEPQLMAFQNQAVPATCKEFAIRMLGTTNPSDFYVDMAWAYKMENRRIDLPSYVTERFNTPYIFQGVPQMNTGTGTWDAQSLDLKPLKSPDDYTLLANQPDANTNAVFFKNTSYFDWPLFVQARIPYSILTTFALEADVTNCPQHLLVPAAKIELLDSYLIPRYPNDAGWSFQRSKAVAELAAATRSRPIEPVGRSLERWGGLPRR